MGLNTHDIATCRYQIQFWISMLSWQYPGHRRKDSCKIRRSSHVQEIPHCSRLKIRHFHPNSSVYEMKILDCSVLKLADVALLSMLACHTVPIRTMTSSNLQNFTTKPIWTDNFKKHSI